MLYSKSRLYSGLVTGALSGFLCFTFLEPLFEPVGLELAKVAHYVLALDGVCVGLALGVMLPTVFPGVCFGASLALFIGSFGVTSMPLYFPIVGGSLVLISTVASVRYEEPTTGIFGSAVVRGKDFDNISSTAFCFGSVKQMWLDLPAGLCNRSGRRGYCFIPRAQECFASHYGCGQRISLLS